MDATQPPVPGHVPSPPDDIIAATKEYRSFMKGGKLQLHHGPTHYHLREHCIKEKNPDFNPQADLVLSRTDCARLLPERGKLLQ